MQQPFSISFLNCLPNKQCWQIYLVCTAGTDASWPWIRLYTVVLQNVPVFVVKRHNHQSHRLVDLGRLSNAQKLWHFWHDLILRLCLGLLGQLATCLSAAYPDALGHCLGPSFRYLYMSSIVLLLLQSVCLSLSVGYYLFTRALERGDKRLEKYDQKPIRFLIPWSIQIVWVMLMMWPTVALNLVDTVSVNNANYIGDDGWHIIAAL